MANPKHELYCQERCAGKSQRQAMLAAYPNRNKWKPETVDNKACVLESDSKIKARLRYLKDEAAKEAILTRAEVLASVSDALKVGVDAVRSGKLGKSEGRNAMPAMASLSKLLLEELPEEVEEEQREFCRDLGLMIAEPFLAVHRQVSYERGGDFWLYGGRSSTKSSYISLEIVYGLMRHPDRSAFIMVKRKTDIREGVYEQMRWALAKLDVLNVWDCNVSPLRMVNKQTGQVITFRGGDNTEKTKAVKAPNGTYFAYLWLEEADQFAGMNELRTVYQSVTRDAGQDAIYFRFHSFNPPRSRKSWANQKIEELKAEGTPVYKANYNDVPREWIPSQTYEDAERLKLTDPESFAHEYLGEPVGFGNEVFERVEVREITPEERKSIDYHYYGVDWGFSVDPFAWVKLGYDAKTRTLYMLDEIVSTGLSNQKAAELVLAKLNATLKSAGGTDESIIEDAEPYAVVWCDSAEPKSIADFRELGINAKAADKQGIHNVRNSIKWLQCRTKIVIDTSCTVAAREFTSYSYELTKDGEATGALVDADNHTIDAVRYGCMTLITDRTLT